MNNALNIIFCHAIETNFKIFYCRLMKNDNFYVFFFKIIDYFIQQTVNNLL